MVYFTADEFFDALADRAFHSKEHASYRFEEENYQLSDADAVDTAELLIIDDLGTELSNEFTDRALFSCINRRLLSGRPTLISTNLSTAQISEHYSRRTYSRIISNFKVFKLFSQDIRLQKKFL